MVALALAHQISCPSTALSQTLAKASKLPAIHDFARARETWGPDGQPVLRLVYVHTKSQPIALVNKKCAFVFSRPASATEPQSVATSAKFGLLALFPSSCKRARIENSGMIHVASSTEIFVARSVTIDPGSGTTPQVHFSPAAHASEAPHCFSICSYHLSPHRQVAVMTSWSFSTVDEFGFRVLLTARPERKDPQ